MNLRSAVILLSAALGLVAPAARAEYFLCQDTYNAIGGKEARACVYIGDASPVRVRIGKDALLQSKPAGGSGLIIRQGW